MKGKKMVWKKYLVLSVVPVAFAALAFWLFRSERFHSEMGEIRYGYVFGFPYSISVDADGDGNSDCEVFLTIGQDHFEDGSGEYFEDWDHDGKHEVHGRMLRGKFLWLELKGRGSGPSLLLGQEAERYLLEHPDRFAGFRLPSLYGRQVPAS